MAALADMNLQITGKQRVKAIVNLISMSDQKRLQVLRKIARKAKTASNQHRRNQTDLDGKRWPARKKGNAKMLRKLGKHLRATANSDEAKLYFANAAVAKMAYAHQHGIDEIFDITQRNKSKQSQEKNQEQNNLAGHTKPATKAQAKRLVDSGLFRIGKRRTKNGKARNGYKGRVPSMKWVIENLTRGQAGSIIRKLKLSKGTKTKWRVPRATRSWLGLTQPEVSNMSDFIINEIAQQF